MAYVGNHCCCAKYFHKENLNFKRMKFCTSNAEKNMHIDLYECLPRGPIIWGNVYDNNGLPMKDSQVYLVKWDENYSSQFNVIFQTKTDRNGYYELELPVHYKKKYRIIVNSAAEETVCKPKNNVCYF